MANPQAGASISRGRHLGPASPSRIDPTTKGGSSYPYPGVLMTVLVCRCAGRLHGSAEGRSAAAQVATDVVVDDLCRLAAKNDPRLREWAQDPDLTIVACRKRTLQGLFDWCGVKITVLDADTQRPVGTPGLQNGVRVLDMEHDATAIAALPKNTKPIAMDAPSEDAWDGWFPVIDRDRCVDCRKCHNFCLFGVYGDGVGGRVEVLRPELCKSGCPACARVCPKVAIIFPKYRQGGPISGTLEQGEEPVAVDLEKMLTDGDVYAVLRARQKACRFGGKDSGCGSTCEKDVIEKLGIPAEVLALHGAEISKKLGVQHG